jgi:hypothetical protein
MMPHANARLFFALKEQQQTLFALAAPTTETDLLVAPKSGAGTKYETRLFLKNKRARRLQKFQLCFSSSMISNGKSAHEQSFVATYFTGVYSIMIFDAFHVHGP